MKRGKPLRRTGIARGTSQLRRSPFPSLRPGEPARKPLRSRSAKTTALYVERRKLVAALLAERPVCERCHAARSVDCHERLRRSQGGDVLDASDIRCLCRACHDWIGLNPQAAHDEGWTRWSWEAA